MRDKKLEARFLNEVLPHRKIILKVCHQYTNNQNDFNDLFQEILFQIWKSFPGFRGESKVSTWVYRIALNTALYFLRREKRKITTTNLISDCFSVPDENDILKEQAEVLKQMIAQLSEIEKAIILLHLDEFSNDEIASIIGISKTNTATRLSRIKQKLIKKYQNGF